MIKTQGHGRSCIQSYVNCSRHNPLIKNRNQTILRNNDKEIGYGTISSYYSIRYKLYLDNKNNAYFVTTGDNKKYKIQLNRNQLEAIRQGRQINLAVTVQTPRQIKEDGLNLSNPQIEFL